MKREDLLDLNDVLQHPGRTLAVDISTDLENQEDVDLVTPLEGFVEAVSSGTLLLLSGEFSTRANLECARCSGPLEEDVTFTISEQIPVSGVPSSYGTGDFAKVSPDEPHEMFEGNALIVENLLREELLIALPMQPLCSHGWDEPCPIAEARGVAKGNIGPLGALGLLKGLLPPEVLAPEELPSEEPNA